MNLFRPGRRRFVRILALALPATSARRARAHSYPEAGFTIIHPWCMEAPQGTPELPMSLTIIEITLPDRLLSAATPVARSMVLRPPAGAAPVPLGGVDLHPGRDFVMNPLTPHFVLREITTDLHFGREYPLVLGFARAGQVEAALIIGQH